MTRIETHFWIAGILQWLVAASNLFAARIFRYRENLTKVTPFVREVFMVQNLYIMATVAMFGVLCIAFAPELAGALPSAGSSAVSSRSSGAVGSLSRFSSTTRTSSEPADRQSCVPVDVHLPHRSVRVGQPGFLALRGQSVKINVPWHALVVAAGVGQLVLVAASLLIPRVLGWADDVAKLRPLMRQVFWTYAGYIWTTNLCFGLVSAFAPELLLEPTHLAGVVCGFIAAYWGVRVVIQFAYFDRADTPKGWLFALGETVLVGLFIVLTLCYGGLAARNFGWLAP